MALSESPVALWFLGMEADEGLCSMPSGGTLAAPAITNAIVSIKRQGKSNFARKSALAQKAALNTHTGEINEGSLPYEVYTYIVETWTVFFIHMCTSRFHSSTHRGHNDNNNNKWDSSER